MDLMELPQYAMAYQVWEAQYVALEEAHVQKGTQAQGSPRDYRDIPRGEYQAHHSC
ncbi:hypothetical protein KSB_89830 [Ktedonobacter robiniae]|uniref:Uncharacterized protein n=1 Tax=Ktedonobacter robiniae TaxID=2778365 RepID=A0ABQ3V6D2_9CHLR|nr:hypothetical protein KSB_89830 [Ktedonobacter robiniae]